MTEKPLYTEEEIIHEFEVNMFENDCPDMSATEKICVQNFLSYALDTGMIKIAED